MKLTPLHVCLLVLPLFLRANSAGAAPQSPMANVVILVVRHAEKPDSGPGLAAAGRVRAVAYVRYFQDYRIDSQIRHVDRLIATADSQGSQRPRLTIEPLSQALGLRIDSRFRDKDVASLAEALETRPGGRTILICWHHGEIPALLRDLGEDPSALLPHGRWPSSVYDWVIQLHFDRNGRLLPAQALRISEHLLPGDAD